MGLYTKYVLPRVTHNICSHATLTRQREKVIPLATGRVLEVGIGSGLNLALYKPGKVKHIWGLDPSLKMWNLARPRKFPFNIEFLQASAESIPLDDGLADTVVVTYTLCSIPGVIDALKEMRRVLKPGGQLVFCEHGSAREENVRKWQDRLNPVWKKIGGGCNLNRPIPRLLNQGGFNIQAMETMYIAGWKPACFNYWGTAN